MPGVCPGVEPAPFRLVLRELAFGRPLRPLIDTLTGADVDVDGLVEMLALRMVTQPRVGDLSVVWQLPPASRDGFSWEPQLAADGDVLMVCAEHAGCADARACLRVCVEAVRRAWVHAAGRDDPAPLMRALTAASAGSLRRRVWAGVLLLAAAELAGDVSCWETELRSSAAGR